MRLRFTNLGQLVAFVTKQKLPDWQASLFKRNAEAVQVHSQGHIFHKIDQLFPNEHPDSKAHRILAFESITEPSFGRAANNVNRIFRNSSYTVEAQEKTIAFASENAFEGQNLFNWFLDQWVRYALKEDSNSRIVCYPKEYTDRGNPAIVFVESCFLCHISPDICVFISERESEVKHELKELYVDTSVFHDQTINQVNVREVAKNTYTPKIETKVIRKVYHAFLKGVGFYRIEEMKTNQSEYEVEFFPWKQDFLPVTDAGGEKGKLDVNKSFLHPFVSFGNLALLQHSQHTAVNFTFSFPRMSEIQTPCDAFGCNEGKIGCETESDIAKYGDFKDCLKCKGTGYTVNQTPYKTYVKQYDTQGMEGDNEHLKVPDVQYYTPETSILNYSKQEWRDYLEMAETAVYIQQRVQTGHIEAAKSKEIDREDLYSFLTKVGQVYFSKLRFVLQAYENFNVASPGQVSVGVPYSYAILSEGEAFEALKDILASNVPVMLKASQVESFINKFVSQSSPIRKFLDVLKIVDPLLYYTANEISSFKMNNIVDAQQFSDHVFAYPVLQRMYFNDKNLFLQESAAIVERLKTALLEFKPKPPTDMKTKFQLENEA